MSMLTEENSSGLVAEAQEAINKYLMPGLGARNSIEHYSATSDMYEVLLALGFRQMDALDPSEGMLSKARERNLQQAFNEAIGDTRLPIDDGAYDALVVCGGMGENQIPCSAIQEMIRVVKPGGYIVNVTRVEHLDKCSDYVGRLQPLMRRLEDEGKWKSVSSSTFPNFLRGKEGLVLVHQVL
ncbi:hypothetical protein C0Q70_09270 [Pomacea canaliculata]|uniref:Methyltransferase type 11 domain-containing protein n=1 Tax=Pomacea canaliculata TaxID=400727 RepID=A0A2T7P9C2_POMCA|nr:hypothetical protein C0Q70_09270 [Pomacea canaliculata]